jgi:hypothetical protein
MMKTQWEGHYTGIETMDIELFGRLFDLYLQRNTKSKELEFARVSLVIHRIRVFKHIGIFIGRQNYGKMLVNGGFQLFTNSFHLGFGKPNKYGQPARIKIEYSGSMVKPYEHISIALFGRINFGFDCPEWLKRMKRRQLEAYWDRYAAAFDGECFPGEDGDGTMTNPEQER